MNEITSVITALGVNPTIWMQLGIFVVVFIFLKQVLFTPYFKAFEARQNLTQGNQELAEKIYAQTRELEALYQRKARSINTEIKAIYDKARLESQIEQDKIIFAAKEKSRQLIEKARDMVQGEFNRAHEDILKEAPKVGQAMSDQLLSKEAAQ